MSLSAVYPRPALLGKIGHSTIGWTFLGPPTFQLREDSGVQMFSSWLLNSVLTDVSQRLLMEYKGPFPAMV